MGMRIPDVDKYELHRNVLERRVDEVAGFYRLINV